MLQLNVKTPVDGGFYITGSYTLAIVRYEEGVLDLTNAVEEYTFLPNPTDIDDDTMFPNIIQPDHGGGFYVELNEVGEKVINIRGTTGQFPKKTEVSRLLTGGLGQAAGQMSNLLGIAEKPDGYTEFMRLKNFFIRWVSLIRNSSSYAMLFVNHKDAEFYQVLPSNFRKVRTSARPLHYAYAIVLRVIGEYEPAGHFVYRRTWLDRMDDIRARINQWRQAVNQAALISLYVSSASLSSVTSTVLAPVKDQTNFFNNLSAGMQGLTYTANSIAAQGASSLTALRKASENLFLRTDENVNKILASSSYVSPTPNSSVAQYVVPPTRSNVGRVFDGLSDVVTSSTDLVNTNFSRGFSPSINPDSPILDQYFSLLDLQQNAYLATELAPLPDSSPVGDSDINSRLMHQGARSGTGGFLEALVDEISSATLFVETSFLGTTRQKSDPSDYAGPYPLAYVASSVLGAWRQQHNESISPALDSFRRGFLGLRNPATLSPLYRVVNVQTTDTIYSLAAKYLGSWDRWFEIALINDLRYPYISSDGGQYCRTPGESIYIPEPNANVPPEVVERLSTIIKVHDKVKISDAFLGFDIKLDETTGDAIFDGYDYVHTTGADAYLQEASMVLMGSGGLSYDRLPGPTIKVGSKSRGPAQLAVWTGILKQWLAADPRVDEVRSVKIVQESSVVSVYMNIKFAYYDDAISLAVNIRR